MTKRAQCPVFPLILLALFSGTLPAAEPFAILTVSGDIKLNGKPLPTVGAPNWPLEAGDELTTGTANAAVVFSDGMRIRLAYNSKVAVQRCDHCVVQFYDGALDYDKPVQSKADICVLGRRVRPVPGSQGSVTIEPPDKVVVRVASEKNVLTSGKCPCKLAAPWGITGKMAIVGLAGAAATAGAITATRPSSSTISP